MVAKGTSKEEVLAAYRAATLSMARLNLTGARLMHKHGATAATDVTGFGILGHAANLASNQLQKVDMVLHTLPIIKGMVGIARTMGNMFQLLQVRRGLGGEGSRREYKDDVTPERRATARRLAGAC